MNKLFLSILFSLFIVQLGYSQRLSDWVDAANESFIQKDYYSAYKYYGIALEYDDTKTDTWYRYAESARLFDIYTKAEVAYHQVVSSEDNAAFPLATLHLGEVSQRLGKYDQAITMYQRFLDESENASQTHKDIALRGLEDSSWAKEVISNQSDITIRNLTDSINSPYSDFGATLKGDTFYFSALKFIYEKDSIIPPRPFSKIIEVVDDLHTPLEESINGEGQHGAFSAFNHDYSKVYYAKCHYAQGNQTDVVCDLYVSDLTADGAWLPGQKLALNTNGYTSTAPNIGYNKATGQEVLYFASNRLGGRGGLDIWMAEISQDGTIGSPSNLADINTPNNEMAPFYSSAEDVLFFGTDGRQSLGGYDIYSSTKQGDEWQEPTHMGAPVNSSYDDLYYSVFEDGETAYFSSKRPDSTAIFWDETKETCCFDIYTYKRNLWVNLLVTTFNKLDNTELLETTVSLYEVLPNGEEVLIETKQNPLANDFNFKLAPGKKYKIKGEKEGFTTDIATIDLKDPALENKTEIEQELYLEPGLDLLVTTFNNLDSTALNGVMVELYELTPEGEVLIDTHTNLDNNDFSFPLARNKKYVIKGKKDGYPIATDSIDLTDPALAKLPQIERELYLGQELEILVFDEADKTPLNKANVKLYKIDDDGKKTLIADRFNPHSNDFLFPLDLQKQYMLDVEREEYIGRSNMEIVFDPAIVKETGGRITIEVPLERKVPKLPLALYFDNDHPNPRTTRTTTNLDYMTTNKAYVKQKGEFIKSITEGLSKDEKYVTSRQYNSFFKRDVLKGGRDLKKLTAYVHKRLEAGKQCTIVLKGYASPRSGTNYNNKLSQRRNSSVINYFKEYEGGTLVKYINNGSLQFTQEALGESTAAQTISDKLGDKKGSIFSLVASAERRVEIVEIIEK